MQISENSFLKKELEISKNDINLIQVQFDKYRELVSTKQFNIAALETKVEGNNDILNN
jgi:hypothetical protein